MRNLTLSPASRGPAREDFMHSGTLSLAVVPAPDTERHAIEFE
jgi:hypothetical protein